MSLKLLAVADLHNRFDTLSRILDHGGPADVVLLGGDLTSFGTPEQAEMLVRRAQDSAEIVLAVAGNCDSASIERRLIGLGVSLYQRGRVVQGVGFHGLSAMPPWHSFMYQFSEEELADHLQAGYGQIAGAEQHVVLSHPPPRATTVDRVWRGENVGSTALRAFIERTQPDVVFCGHVHEGRAMEQIGPTVVVNCGPAAAGMYAVAEVGSAIQVELRQI